MSICTASHGTSTMQSNTHTFSGVEDYLAYNSDQIQLCKSWMEILQQAASTTDKADEAIYGLKEIAELRKTVEHIRANVEFPTVQAILQASSNKMTRQQFIHRVFNVCLALHDSMKPLHDFEENVLIAQAKIISALEDTALANYDNVTTAAIVQHFGTNKDFELGELTVAEAMDEFKMNLLLNPQEHEHLLSCIEASDEAYVGRELWLLAFESPDQVGDNKIRAMSSAELLINFIDDVEGVKHVRARLIHE